ncbi:hypothetical protein KC19_VG055000 [Ceratodon purpureus]|uniref:Protein kinase domain-containing protein n=1 Tax=Ceratodon purpureus TaxID=3225 RepID=A0A8T0HML9_CERPU|nr:hypothetical protein KC19_VG055000 [Ceratodon purpureus]
MPKNKKQKNVGEWANKFDDMLSLRCRDYIVAFIVEFYQENTLVSLNSRYVRYGEDGPRKFKSEMETKIRDRLMDPCWHSDTQKPGYDHFVSQRAHDALWNAKEVITKYAKAQRGGVQAFKDTIAKADCFTRLMAPLSSRKHRRASITWWNSPIGMETAADLRKRHLTILADFAIFYYLDKEVQRGGYATIRRVRFEGNPEIPPYWEFAEKRPLNWSMRPDLARVDHNNESLAIRIPHPGVIRFMAIHQLEHVGFMFWWNGGTLRAMLQRDNEAPGDLPIDYIFRENAEDSPILGKRLQLFRSKRTELAWALCNIIDAVHKYGYLQNDLSPDNILLHFLEDESKIYIEVCDWGLMTKTLENRRSPWVFDIVHQMEETMTRRYWVDPRVVYVHKENQDIQIIPDLTVASEDFAGAKIAAKINRGNMCTAYHEAEPVETRHFQNIGELAMVFEGYLERVCQNNRGTIGGLGHLINRFRDTHNWPTPFEHYRVGY